MQRCTRGLAGSAEASGAVRREVGPADEEVDAAAADAVLGGVLGVEFADLGEGEVAEPEGLDLDVEGAGGAEPVRIPAAGDLVVAHVAQAAEGHGGRKVGRTAREVGAELPEDAEQAGAALGVDLVEEEDERARTGARPGAQGCADESLVALGVDGRWPQLGRELALGAEEGAFQQGTVRRADVVTPGSSILAREGDRSIPARRGEVLGERAQGGGVAPLAGSWLDVDELHPLHEGGYLGQAARRLNHAVALGDARSGGVEAALHGRT
ncbi:hypothetical protein [Chondromyces apiculatus]|uniref:hypothetical protein n=1 Tax=Chondromyces apiculatus TaxID=51 RepID=UPI0005C5E469|nr:hypothetical protein [Chondromyces apiculatus]